jgi:hypothetical protein
MATPATVGLKFDLFGLDCLIYSDLTYCYYARLRLRRQRRLHPANSEKCKNALSAGKAAILTSGFNIWPYQTRTVRGCRLVDRKPSPHCHGRRHTFLCQADVRISRGRYRFPSPSYLSPAFSSLDACMEGVGCLHHTSDVAQLI